MSDSSATTISQRAYKERPATTSFTWINISRQRRQFAPDKEKELRRELVQGKGVQEQRPCFVSKKER
jgi:hypothetical protein